MTSPNNTELHEEIDLRPYIEALLRRWKLLTIVPILVAIITFGLLSLIPPQYRATALVAITKPRFNVQFDPRFETIEDLGIGYGAYQSIALSDELVSNLYNQLTNKPESIETLDEFKEDMLAAGSGENETLLALYVTSDSPQLATEIANQWASLVVVRSNELYGNSSTDSVIFLESQLNEAKHTLSLAENLMVDFESRNNSRVLQNELSNLVNRQEKYLRSQSGLEDLIRDIDAFHNNLAQKDVTLPISQAEQLTALSLQSRIFNASLGNVELNLGNGIDLLSSSRASLIVNFESLVMMLEARIDTFDQLAAELAPQILTIQEQLTELQNEQNRLSTELNRARDSKNLLTRSLEEARISSQEVGNQVKLAGKAIEPQESIERGRVINSLIAAVSIGLFLCFWVFASEWWHQDNTILNPSRQ